MLRQSLSIALPALSIWLGGCAFHSTAKDWNGLTGTDGKPKYYKVTSKVGVNLFVGLPVFGDTTINGMVDDLTEDISKEKGDHVRIVQGTSENYWYGFPPFTWILTPVVYTVAAEYDPDAGTYHDDQQEIEQREAEESSLNPTTW